MLNLQGISGFFCAGFLLRSRYFSLRFVGFGPINIAPRHQPVKRFAEQGFNPLPSSSIEKEESTGRRIHLKLVFNNSAESVNGFSHVDATADNVDLLNPGDVA